MEKLERLERNLKYMGNIINIYTDVIKTADGKIVNWDFISHRGAAAVVPVRKDGKILMVRQYRNALDRYTLEIPAGALDTEEEDMKVCAARELAEETGYTSENLEWLIDINTWVAFCNEKIGVYVARELKEGCQHLDEDEYIDVCAYSLDELCEMIFRGEIMDSKTIAAIMAYKAKYA